jgi:hypothetical protein
MNSKREVNNLPIYQCFILVRSNRGYLECEDYPDQRHVLCHTHTHIYIYIYTHTTSNFFMPNETRLRVGKFCDNTDYLSA